MTKITISSVYIGFVWATNKFSWKNLKIHRKQFCRVCRFGFADTTMNPIRAIYLPYCKPTLVNTSRRRRRLREPCWRNSANWSRNFGRRDVGGRPSTALNQGWRLFTKNTWLCEVATRCIGSDACPVLET